MPKPRRRKVARSSLSFTSMTLRSGSRRLYSAFSVGRRSELTAVGLGFGSHLSRGRHYAELELELLGIFRNSRSPGVERNQLTRLRANLGRQLDPHLSLYAGLSLNGLNAPGDPVLVEPYGNQKLRLARGTRVWPGITAGLRLGRQ